MKCDLMRVLLILNATEKGEWSRKKKRSDASLMTQGTLIKMWQLLSAEKGTME